MKPPERAARLDRSMDAAFRPDEWSRHTSALRRMARGMLREEDLAEDLVQNTWLTALERPPRVLSRAWLTAVLRSRARDMQRGRVRADDTVHRAGDDRPQDSGGEQIAEQLELHEHLSAAVRRLDEPYRRVVYLRYFEELPPSEIAARLELPLKTIKTQLHRGLARLREQMERKYGEGPSWQAALVPLAFRHPAFGPSAPLPGAVLGFGAGIMLKKLALVGALLLGSFGLYRITSSERSAQVEPEAEPLPAPALALEEPGAAPRPGPALEAGARVVVPAQSRSESPPIVARGDLIVQVVWADGQPAADIGVSLEVRTPALPNHGIARVVTDEEGSARAFDVPPGLVVVRSDRGDREEARVVAGEERELRLVLAERAEVVGTVLDAAGHPVAAAGIWLTTSRSNWLGGRVVAHTDASGRFALRSVDATRSLGAVASGFAPSKLVDLETLDPTGGVYELELRLLEPGADLRVHVTSAGLPIPGALVACGELSDGGERRSNGTYADVWSPRACVADAEGSAFFPGLAIGEQLVSVRAEGLPVLTETLVVAAGAANELTLDLPAGVTLSGVVRDASGEPAQGALIRAFDRPLDESFVQMGQYDHASVLGYPSAVSDDLGRYTLGPASPGTLYLYAAECERAFGTVSVLHVHETIQAAPGDELVWDVDLLPGLTIAGQVVYSDGELMPDVYVTAIDEGSAARQTLRTGSEGRFVFYNVRPAAYTVSVQLWDAPEGVGHPVLSHVRPGRGDLLLEASYAKPVEEVPGEVRLRILDVAGRLAREEDLALRMNSDQNWARIHFERVGDEFVFEDLPPGRYRLSVLAGEDLIHAGEWFELAPGETRDLGSIETQPGGALEVVLVRPPGTEALEPRIWVGPEQSSHGRWLEFGTESVRLIENGEPGTWKLRMYGEGLASTWATAEVRAGETAVAELELRPATQRVFEIAYPDGVTLAELHLQVYDVGGTELWDWADPQPEDHGRPYRRSLPVPLGTYRVRVDTDVGLSGSLEFTMSTLEPDQPPVRVELKKE